jgi:hypothetical protein
MHTVTEPQMVPKAKDFQRSLPSCNGERHGKQTGHTVALCRGHRQSTANGAGEQTGIRSLPVIRRKTVRKQTGQTAVRVVDFAPQSPSVCHPFGSGCQAHGFAWVYGHADGHDTRNSQREPPLGHDGFGKRLPGGGSQTRQRSHSILSRDLSIWHGNGRGWLRLRGFGKRSPKAYTSWAARRRGGMVGQFRERPIREPAWPG